MAQRRKTPHNTAEGPEQAPASESAWPRVLIVMGSGAAASRLARRVTEAVAGAACFHASTVAAARVALAAESPEVALIDSALADGAGFALAAELLAAGCAPVMLCEHATCDDAIHALRAGAVDILNPRAANEELAGSVLRAAERAEIIRKRDDRIRRLTHICRRLNQSRREMSTHISGLCGDMINAFQEMSDQVGQITTAAEFQGLIRQELDVESLLRTALEYVLAKCGSTNAAVFLPAGSHDYSLGAYVNYDCPKDALDMMLEHMAGIVSTRMADQEELMVLATEQDLAEFLGDDAHWLAECGAVTFACRHNDECLAVVILFRDRRTPFSESALATLRIISNIFAQQLARIVRVHHRHLPKDQWGGFGMGATDEGDDDLDLAA